MDIFPYLNWGIKIISKFEYLWVLLIYLSYFGSLGTVLVYWNFFILMMNKFTFRM